MRGRTDKSANANSASQTLADVKAYFISFYKSSVKGAPRDRHTIPGITEVESRFHYNATENSIIRALIAHDPLPPGAEMWHMMQQRREWKVLDIGSGTGHWLDFYRDVFFAAHVTGIEIVPHMADFLREKYSGRADTDIVCGDISEAGFSLPRRYDIVNAIGVMFHIVDDEKWAQALKNLAALTAPGGLLVMGGDFGDETRNVQFHKRDDFETWQEHDAADGADTIVNKRLRSLRDWQALAAACGLTYISVVRSDSDDAISTPENDVMLLKKPE